ncbi:MAG: DUF6492 family protein [Sphingomonadaceae bacterium]
MTASHDGFAIVTPTYPPDLERCRLLVESLGHCAPTVPHYLIVDRRDARCFRPLTSARTILIESETILEPWLRRIPTRHGYWFNFKGFPVRGWMLQQMLKIGIANVVSEPILVFCDSDVAFIRPFDRDAIMQDGKVGLLDLDFADDRTRRWSAVSCALLGLDPARVALRAHVGNMICWRRDLMLALQKHIEGVSGSSWQQTIARLRTVSEYALYGSFVRNVIGYENSGHAPSDRPLIKPSWGTDIAAPGALDAFFAGFAASEIGIMAHSKDAVDLPRLRALLEREWAHAPITAKTP